MIGPAEAPQRRNIGHTGLDVSVLGFGGAAIGNLYSVLTEDDARATVEAALASGINYFDTAPLYGHGLSEHRLGQVLRDLPREDYVLSTKVGRRLRPTDPVNMDYGQFPGSLPFTPYFDYSYDGVMRSIEDSLQRLGLQRIDIALIHDIDHWTHGSSDATQARYREAMEGAYPALCELRAQGTVAAIGAGVNEWQVCQRLAEAGDFDCFLLAGRYTLLEHEPIEEFLPLCESKSISVVIGGPYNTGILATGAVEGAYYNYQPAPAEILARVRKIESICNDFGVSLAGAALQFPLSHPAVAAVIPGMRSADEVYGNTGLVAEHIPPGFWESLRDQGLLPESARTPAYVTETVHPEGAGSTASGAEE